MKQTRRSFLKLAGAAGIVAAMGPSLATAAEQQKPQPTSDRKDLPRGMTFCTIRSDGQYSLGIRTSLPSARS